ncbi:hypothetical protein OPT61_g2969 [Boeremia exigua]|uniref:Uncharacterized protein n=1 Tax=Boeremia exigua TaxID=749465 RepID=A0ACC2IJV4_9PLEO|nr:hypothetical protein OPT61_g2969 [Boeremia exigua]
MIEKTSPGPYIKTEDVSQEETKKPGLNIALMIGAYWLAWSATVVTDTLISVRRQFWPGELFIKSPIIRYIYTNHIYQWPLGGYYTLEPFFTKWSPTINAASFVSSTICTLLQLMSIGHISRFTSYLSDALLTLWMAICMLSGSWLGLTRHEVGIIALPLGWLSGKTVQLACLGMGIYPAEISENKERMAFIASQVIFGVVYAREVSSTPNIIAFVLLIEAALMVWRWLAA